MADRHGTNASVQQITQLIAVLAGNSSPQQKAAAEMALVRMNSVRSDSQIAGLLQQHNMNIMNGHVVMKTADGQWIPMTQANGQAFSYGSSALPDRGLGGTKASAWAEEANKIASVPRNQMGGSGNANQGATGGTNSTQFSDVGNVPGSQNYDPNMGAAAQSHPGDVGGQANQNSFYRGVAGDALDELASGGGGPNSDAWSMYLSQGGPGGGSLANSTAADYGQNDFQSAMALAPILNKGAGLTGADTLGYTQDTMNRGQQAGQYTDPRKVFDTGLANLQGETVNNQKMGLSTLLDNLGTYMDPTQYAMLKSRVQQVLNQYITQGYQNPTADQSGKLLQQVQQAAGF